MGVVDGRQQGVFAHFHFLEKQQFLILTKT